MSRNCRHYKKYYNVRIGLIFEDVKLDILTILRIYYKYSTKQSLTSIQTTMNINIKLVRRVMSLMLIRISVPDFSANKLGGPGKIVQVDETMMNYKFKSHRGRSPITERMLCPI